MKLLKIFPFASIVFALFALGLGNLYSATHDPKDGGFVIDVDFTDLKKKWGIPIIKVVLTIGGNTYELDKTKNDYSQNVLGSGKLYYELYRNSPVKPGDTISFKISRDGITFLNLNSEPITIRDGKSSGEYAPFREEDKKANRETTPLFKIDINFVQDLAAKSELYKNDPAKKDAWGWKFDIKEIEIPLTLDPFIPF